MMWWLVILGAPAALVAYELLDEDRRAAWVKRWAEINAHTCEFGEHCGRLCCRGPRRAGGYRARESVNPRTIRAPRSPTGVTPRQRAALDTSELQDLIDRRNGGAGLRSGGKIGLSERAGLDTSEWRDLLRVAKGQQCYTCELLNREDAGPHEYEHPLEDLVEAERAERGLRPHRVQALLALVNHARASADLARELLT